MLLPSTPLRLPSDQTADELIRLQTNPADIAEMASEGIIP